MAFPGAPSAEIPALERDWWRAVVRGTFRATDSAAALADFEGGFAWLWETYARADAWTRFWQAEPPPGFHDIFAMTSTGAALIEGDLTPLRRHLRFVKALLALPRERDAVEG